MMHTRRKSTNIAEWVSGTMVHMDLALEEGGEGQGQGQQQGSTEAEERIREVIGGMEAFVHCLALKNKKFLR